MNIFQKIGNRLEEDKKNKELFEKRYWNLTPIERIDYDNKRDRIEKEEYNYPTIIITYIKILIYLSLGTLLFYYISGESIKILELGINVISIFGSLFILIVIVDFLIMFFSQIKCSDRIKNLNKRFKLDTRHI